MGSHANYYLIIEHLITLKGEFYRVTKERYQAVIKELSNYEVYPHSDNDHLPDYKILATKLEYSQSAMNSILKDLLQDLIRELSYPPLIIQNHVHHIHIHIPYDEQRLMTKDYRKEVEEEYTWINMVLPVTPNIGDEIELPFVEQTGRYYRGFVHEVQHRIKGIIQEIYIDVHPWDDFYYKWEKMKEECKRQLTM